MAGWDDYDFHGDRPIRSLYYIPALQAIIKAALERNPYLPITPPAKYNDITYNLINILWTQFGWYYLNKGGWTNTGGMSGNEWRRSVNNTYSLCYNYSSKFKKGYAGYLLPGECDCNINSETYTIRMPDDSNPNNTPDNYFQYLGRTASEFFNTETDEMPMSVSEYMARAHMTVTDYDYQCSNLNKLSYSKTINILYNLINACTCHMRGTPNASLSNREIYSRSGEGHSYNEAIQAWKAASWTYGGIAGLGDWGRRVKKGIFGDPDGAGVFVTHSQLWTRNLESRDVHVKGLFKCLNSNNTTNMQYWAINKVGQISNKYDICDIPANTVTPVKVAIYDITDTNDPNVTGTNYLTTGTDTLETGNVVYIYLWKDGKNADNQNYEFHW